MIRLTMQMCERALGTVVAIATAFLLSGAAVLSAQTNPLTGTWVSVTHQLDDGTGYKVFYQLKQNGTQLSGRVIYPWGIVELHDGKVQGTHFSFDQPLWEGWIFQDEGEVTNGELHFRGTDWDRQWHTYTAQRTSDHAGDPRAPRSLPALREVRYNGLAKTPPMGWNSWNKFGTKVTGELIRNMADVMVSSGMRDAGYVYVNIDDAWEGQRGSDGALVTNHKFGDMKPLADYVHSKGLKLGIYSSPGAHTCAGYTGSFGHEQQDADTFANWGIDYLKYDTCGAGKIYHRNQMRAVYQIMGEALLKCGRPIVFSVSSNDEAYNWARAAGANLWRTTGDIGDNWKRVSDIGFSQNRLGPFAGPGHWNDPDMLEVGNGGMTADEYRTHMSLWAILAAPLLAGNDLRVMTDETKSILMNYEVIAIDQDPLGKQGTRIWGEGTSEIWAKPLSNGALAVGLFNRGEAPATIQLDKNLLQLSTIESARDLWKHTDVQFSNGVWSANVPRHGVALLLITR